MKNKFIILLVFLINISYFCFAQAEQGGRGNRAEAIQVAFLTRELALTSEESEKFWPVYNNYRAEIKKARKDKREDEVAFEETVVNIRKKYKSEFKKVLGSDQRVNQIFVSEKNFRELLRKELMERRKKGASL
ncbi:MAG: hypothetical protein JWQ96_1875 [Segetibacter sp.]|nr:hypothetical protein [Segetibacter sp.]